MRGSIQSATVEYETPEGTATDTIEEPKRVDGWGDGLEVFERRDGAEIEHSYSEERLIKVQYEYDFEEEPEDTEEIERPEVDETFRNIGRALLLAIGFAFGGLTTYAVTHSGGQVGF